MVWHFGWRAPQIFSERSETSVCRPKAVVKLCNNRSRPRALSAALTVSAAASSRRLRSCLPCRAKDSAGTFPCAARAAAVSIDLQQSPEQPTTAQGRRWVPPCRGKRQCRSSVGHGHAPGHGRAPYARLLPFSPASLQARCSSPPCPWAACGAGRELGGAAAGRK